jgi:hypothetical protein
MADAWSLFQSSKIKKEDLKKILFTILRASVFFGVGFAILFLLYRSQNAAFQEQCALDGVPPADCSLLRKIFDDFRNANFFWILMMLLAFMLSNVSRALRWNMLIKPMGYTPKFLNSFLIVMLGYFANLGLPRLGEVIRAGALAKYEKIPPEKVMGTVVADRALDVLALLLVVGLAFVLEFDVLWGWLQANANLGAGKTGAYTLLGIAASVMMLFAILVYIFRKRIRALSFFRKVARLMSGFWEGLISVRRVDNWGILAFHSVFIWFMYYLMAYLCFFAFGPTSHLTASAALVVFTFGAFGISIPSPGGMGTYHFLVMAALALYNIPGSDAFSFANIIYFTIQIFANVLFGLVALAVLPIINVHTPKEATVVPVPPR